MPQEVVGSSGVSDLTDKQQHHAADADISELSIIG
jgi:hypothetical protein